MKIPKTLLRSLGLLLALSTASTAFSQQDAPKVPPSASEAPKLTKFDLDFPGGTPQELVNSIQKAMGRPINVIIPTQFTGIKIPPLMMKQVDAAELFKGLSRSSHQDVLAANPGFPGQTFPTDYIIENDGRSPSDDSVWFLRGSNVPQPQNLAREAKFFLLTPYLEGGLTVDDITTAIQTGWKMGANLAGAELSYHKETKLLIVVGNNMQIQTVIEALHALAPQRPKTPDVDKSAEAKKPEK